MSDPTTEALPSGATHPLVPRCTMKEACPVEEAYQLQDALFEALREQERICKKYAQRRQMALFVKEITESTAKESSIGASDAWGALKGKGKSGYATSYDSSYLKEDIDEINKKIEDAEKVSEKKAEALVAHLESADFNAHLLRHHQDVPLSDEQITWHYQVSGDDRKGLYREIDHIAAQLTQRLGATKTGQTFLGKLLSDAQLKALPGFKDVWDNINKVKDATEAHGLYFYNASQYVADLIGDLNKAALDAKSRATTIADIAGDPKLKPYLDFMDAKLGYPYSTWIETRATDFAGRAERAAARFNEGHKQATGRANARFNKKHQNARRGVAVWSDIDKETFDVKFSGDWFKIAAGSISFALSIIQLTQNLKKAGFKDYMGTLNDLVGLAQTSADVYANAAAQAEKQAASMSDEAVGAARLRPMVPSKQAAAAAKGLGIVAGLIGAVLNVVGAIEGIKSRDWDVVTINVIGLGLSIAGIYAAVVGLAAAAAVIGVLGIILAMVAMLVIDPKIIDYLEDTYWGEDGVIKIPKTIDTFFTSMFSLSVRFVKTDYDLEDSHILLESTALADGKPVYVELFGPGKKKGKRVSLGRKAVYPNRSQVDKKGAVQKNVQWATTKPFAPRGIMIHKPWDIWSLKRDDVTAYDIEAEMSPGPLKDSTTAETMPKKQDPLLYPRYSPKYQNETQIRGATDVYIAYPDRGQVGVNVYTKYSDGCFVEVYFEKEEWGTNPVMGRTTVPCSTDAFTDTGLKRTQVSLSVSDPGTSYYEMLFYIRLLDEDQKELEKTYSSIYIARQAYIDAQR
ncbi:MAG: hypothetical protein AAGI71_13350 [Bacteroidota bacterium]